MIASSVLVRVAVAWLAASSPLEESPPLFFRVEPNLQEGRMLLEQGDVDSALERFRNARPTTDDERAVVEYDVGAALLQRAQDAAGAQDGPGAPAPQAGTDGTDRGQATGPLQDARASFERAWGLARDPRLKSEAALAAGNAAAQGNELDEAVAQYRRALVADPQNLRARQNLRRVLAQKQQQPPPQNGNDDKKQEQGAKDGEKKDNQGGSKEQPQSDQSGDPRNQQKGDDGTPRDDSPPEGGNSRQDDPNAGDERKDAPGSGDGSPRPEDHDEAPNGADTEAKDKGSPAQDKPGARLGETKKQKKDEARRLLDAMRARERPLTPLEMRGKQRQQRPKGGKDW